MLTTLKQADRALIQNLPAQKLLGDKGVCYFFRCR